MNTVNQRRGLSFQESYSQGSVYIYTTIQILRPFLAVLNGPLSKGLIIVLKWRHFSYAVSIHLSRNIFAIILGQDIIFGESHQSLSQSVSSNRPKTTSSVFARPLNVLPWYYDDILDRLITTMSMQYKKQSPNLHS